MSSIASLGKMISGLSAAQKGLQVTGHNLSNSNTQGYTRQQLLQHESFYMNVGSNGKLLQVGTGVTPTEIRQIRSELADRRIRTENSVLNFYQAKNAGVQEVEAILDEPYGEGISKMLEKLWTQAQKLSTSAGGMEERNSFIQAANVLIKKANQISDSLYTYQDNLNDEVKRSVGRINELLNGIHDCNEKVAAAEVNGDNANDYRDERNLLLDELSGYMEIDYYEEPDNRIVLKAEGHTVVDKQFITTLEFKQTVAGSPFVNPIWSNTKEEVFDFERMITPGAQNDTGKLKGLLLNRGNDYVHSDKLGSSAGAVIVLEEGTSWDDIALNDNYSVDAAGNSYFIPKITKKLNDFVNELVTMCNNSFNGQGIGISANLLGVPMFVPIKTPADYPYSGTQKPAEVNEETANAADYAAYVATYNQYVTEYTKYIKDISACLVPGNIKVNPDLLDTKNGGHNRLGTVDPTKADKSNNKKVIDFLSKWNEKQNWPEKSTDPTVMSSSSSPYAKQVDIMSFYAEFVTEIGLEGSIYKQKAREKETNVLNIENERQAIGGVSQDEEFTNMLKYQYAYNASARMITMMDSMMDTIINKM